MDNSVYKVIELVGTSEESWEDAAKNAVEMASTPKDVGAGCPELVPSRPVLQVGLADVA